MKAPTQTTEIIDENATKLLVNYDVAKIIQNAMSVLKGYGKLVDDVEINGKHLRGILYQDSVITIFSDRTKRNVVVHRNRTGTVVIGIANGYVNLYHWELAFVENHIEKLVERLNSVPDSK